ncbi:MAG: rRNA methyltransferase, partial [Cephaloticoccus sp.]
REDAFRYVPSFAGAAEGANRAAVCDWLFCDLVEEPHHVLRHIVEPWLARGWCRRFVVNLKFGRVDPLALLRELRAPGSVLSRLAPGTRIRQLYHDREEFTLTGVVKPAE